MKKIFFLTGIIFLALSMQAQQQSSKKKSSDKLYEKGKINRKVRLEGASGVNTQKYEFSPTYYQNGIVFVSYFKSGPVDPNTGKPFFELFYAETDDRGFPQKPREFSIQINSQKHEGPVSFSRDGNLMYFTRNNIEGGISKPNGEGRVNMKIYEARRGQYDWEQIKPLPFNNDEYTCFHPALSVDGQRLYFSSNMPGGYGGYDLYFTDKVDDNWSQPVNLGAEVNTPQDEAFPFVHESGRLFFSSKGHDGMGGLDIFMIDVSGDEWGELYNMGVPFNSAQDDFGFILNKEGNGGFLTSDRPGGAGGDDIYIYEADGPIVEKEEVTLQASVVAYDMDSGERLANAGIRILRQSEEGYVEGDDLYDVELTPSESGELLMTLVRKSANELDEPTLFTDINGQAEVELLQDRGYVIVVSKEGYQSGEIMHSTDDPFEDQTIRVALKENSCTNLKGLVSINGYQNGVPSASIRILNKSTGREDELVSNGDGLFDYCLPAGFDYSITAVKEGYSEGTAEISIPNDNPRNEEITIRLHPLEDKVVNEPIREGSVIVLESIYYDFDKHFIRKGAARELDALAQLMLEYPSMEVELIAHTDSRGDDKYNLDLSVKRADSAKRYLIAKGVESHRIEAFGYGEQQIRNHCTNGVKCSEDEHQYNRRTEVKVIRIDEPVKVEYEDEKPADRG